MYTIADEIIMFIEKNRKLKSEFDSMKKKPDREEYLRAIFQGDPKRHIMGKCTITISICDRKDITQSHIGKCVGRYKLAKSQKNVQSPSVHERHQTVWSKMKKN